MATPTMTPLTAGMPPRWARGLVTYVANITSAFRSALGAANE